MVRDAAIVPPDLCRGGGVAIRTPAAEKSKRIPGATTMADRTYNQVSRSALMHLVAILRVPAPCHPSADDARRRTVPY